VLVLITDDPRASPRAAEALRIALGLVAGEASLTLALGGPAVHLLDEDTDALVDGDEVARHRAALARLGVAVHLERGARPAEPGWNPDGQPVVEIGPAELGALAAGTDRVLVF
jgi:hypothetical protein